MRRSLVLAAAGAAALGLLGVEAFLPVSTPPLRAAAVSRGAARVGGQQWQPRCQGKEQAIELLELGVHVRADLTVLASGRVLIQASCSLIDRRTHKCTSLPPD
jgi:hypothetical protein